jgi:hypothetical protein
VLPGERITLIKKIAERLAEAEPEDIQLTLGQFGVNYEAYIDHNFVFDSFRTALRSIEHTPDDTLLGLHAYLFGEAAPSFSRREQVLPQRGHRLRPPSRRRLARCPTRR